MSYLIFFSAFSKTGDHTTSETTLHSDQYGNMKTCKIKSSYQCKMIQWRLLLLSKF